MEEQSALNEEVWASHTALEARVAKTEEWLVDAGQQLIQESGHIFVAAALEKRLGTLLPVSLNANTQGNLPAHGSTLWLSGCHRVQNGPFVHRTPSLPLNRLIGCACVVASQAQSVDRNMDADRGCLCAENQEQAQAATMRENVELKAKVASLENALNGAACDLLAGLCSRQSAQSAYDSKPPHCAKSVRTRRRV